MDRTWVAAVGALAATGLGVGIGLHRADQLRRGRAAFHRRPLEAAIGAGKTEAHRVRLWLRAPEPGRHELVVERQGGAPLARVRFDVPAGANDGTCALQYPDDFEGAPPLSAVTRYGLSVTHVATGRCIGTARCETAPIGLGDTPERFALAVMSCHLPFDDKGRPSARARRLLEGLPALLDSYGVKRVLMVGDQIYGDYPPHCSLFNRDYFACVAPPGRSHVLDCTRAEVRKLYQERHRLFWGNPGFGRLQACFACHMILDDHEVVDNFGTAPEHSDPRFDNLRQGALDAFYDYQASRELPALQDGARPSSFHHDFEYGSVATFVMDLRSERRATPERIEIASEEQWRALESFLRVHSSKHVVFIVLSVPLLHVPDWLANAGVMLTASDGDVADRWSNPKARGSVQRLAGILRRHQRQHPEQKLVLLGGDVHIGAVSRISWSDDTPDAYQLISSAVSNRSGFVLLNLAELVPRLGAVLGIDDEGGAFEGELLRAPDRNDCDGEPCNPYPHLNVGIVEVQRTAPDQSSVRLRLIGHDGGPAPQPRVVFDSGPL